MKTIVSDNGQIEIPADFLKASGITPGQVFEFEKISDDEFRLRRAVEQERRDDTSQVEATNVANDFLVRLDAMRKKCRQTGFSGMSAEAWDELSRMLAGE